MAQPATNPKIEELRFKLKTDPKSRLFYQLAEELRKSGQHDEAEQVLRSGLQVYPTYLAAWVSLGRTLRDKKNDGAAVEALNKALQLDPGNVVAARLLGDAYLALGEKVEAIKKYKLVLALLSTDDELRETVARLDRELHPPQVAAAEPQDEPLAPEPVAAPQSDAFAAAAPAPPAAPAEEPFPSAEPRAVAAMEESPFDKTVPPFAEAERILGEELRIEEATADAEPMSRAHDESPFEEPVSGFTSATLEIEASSGFHIDPAPAVAEVPAPVYEEQEEISTAAPAAASPAEDVGNTLTMADLYVRQGLVEDARHIYENILARDPGNDEVRAKLDAITSRVNPKVAQLERWLARVSRREVGRV